MGAYDNLAVGLDRYRPAFVERPLAPWRRVEVADDDAALPKALIQVAIRCPGCPRRGADENNCKRCYPNGAQTHGNCRAAYNLKSHDLKLLRLRRRDQGCIHTQAIRPVSDSGCRINSVPG